MTKNSYGSPSVTGKLLIEGDGKYNLKSLIYWGFSLIADIVFLVLGLGVIPDMINEARRQAGRHGVAMFQIGNTRLSIQDMETAMTVFVVIGILGLIVGVIFSIIALRRYQSKISVYETCITGKTVQGLAPTVQEFNVPITLTQSNFRIKGFQPIPRIFITEVPVNCFL